MIQLCDSFSGRNLWQFYIVKVIKYIGICDFFLHLERYKAIAFPWEPRISIYQVRFIIAIVWLIAILVGLPFFAVMQLQDSEGDVLCMENWPIETFKDGYTLLSFCLTYAIPLPLIAVLYTIVVANLNKAARETSDSEGFRTAKAKGKVIRMLIMVVVFYFLCFLPYHCTFLWIEFGGGDSYK